MQAHLGVRRVRLPEPIPIRWQRVLHNLLLKKAQQILLPVVQTLCVLPLQPQQRDKLAHPLFHIQLQLIHPILAQPRVHHLVRQRGPRQQSRQRIQHQYRGHAPRSVAPRRHLPLLLHPVPRRGAAWDLSQCQPTGVRHVRVPRRHVHLYRVLAQRLRINQHDGDFPFQRHVELRKHGLYRGVHGVERHRVQHRGLKTQQAHVAAVVKRHLALPTRLVPHARAALRDLLGQVLAAELELRKAVNTVHRHVGLRGHQAPAHKARGMEPLRVARVVV